MFFSDFILTVSGAQNGAHFTLRWGRHAAGITGGYVDLNGDQCCVNSSQQTQHVQSMLV